MGSIWSGRYFPIKWQRCWSKNPTSVADPGEEPTLRCPPPQPLIFRPNWGSKGRKKECYDTTRPPPPHPTPPIWRWSGSATELTPLNLNETRNSLSLVPLKASMESCVLFKFTACLQVTTLRVRLMKERQWRYIPTDLDLCCVSILVFGLNLGYGNVWYWV